LTVTTRRVSSAVVGACLLALAGPAAAAEPKVHFSPQGAFPQALAKALLKAEKSIDIALYSFQATSKAGEEDYKALLKKGQVTPLDALAERAKAGVKIRVILNKANSDASNSKTAAKLIDAGIQVYTVSGTMHSKYAIVDGHTVINGSGNWSIGAFNRYHENWIEFPADKALAKAFQHNMDMMLAENKRVKPKKGGGLQVVKGKAKKVARRTKAQAGVIFTTDNDGEKTSLVEDALVKAIDGAKSTAFAAVAHLNTKRLGDALLKAHERGVKVRILVDLGEYSNRVSQAPRLQKAKLDVRYHAYSVKMFFPFAQLMHHKALLVDGKTLITGSYNWSRTAEWSNHENVQILTQKSVVKAFSDELEALWVLRRDEYPGFMKRVRAKKGTADYRRFLPCHFPPMALSGKEMAALRRAYIKAGFAMRGYKGKKASCEFWNLDQEKRVGTNDLPEPPHKPFFDRSALVISEVCHAPKAQRSGEFIELFNGSTEAVDLKDYVISDGDSDDALVQYKKRTTKLKPGQVALVIDPDFDGDFQLPKGTVVVTVANKTLGNGLSDGDVVTLRTTGGQVPDTAPLEDGPSVHRRSLLQASSPGNWSAGKPSPGVVPSASK
jgi:phosphatidylserine/phosphatidylglycerophosphate/cardiolipin synthase-like enzyme